MSFVIAVLCSCLVCGGYEANAQEVITVKQGSTEVRVLVLPFSYATDTTMVDKGEIRVTHLRKGKADFKSQLYNAALKTAAAGGNVLMITRMQDHKQKDKYKIWGTAYQAGNYESIKTKALGKKREKLENGKYSSLIIYRPAYNSGFNDGQDMVLYINDTLMLKISANTKYIIQVPGSCDLRIASRQEMIVQHIKAEPGNSYYIRAYTNIPGSHKSVRNGDSKVELKGYTPYFETIDNAQGSLESSLVTLVTVSKKL